MARSRRICPWNIPTRFDFALNLKTAKDLNLTIPPTLLGLANTVIGAAALGNGGGDRLLNDQVRVSLTQRSLLGQRSAAFVTLVTRARSC